MGVLTCNSTLSGGVTPVCNCCGCHLCWDVSDVDYRKDQAFWDDWICRDCNGGTALSLNVWRQQRQDRIDRPGWRVISELGRLL